MIDVHDGGVPLSHGGPQQFDADPHGRPVHERGELVQEQEGIEVVEESPFALVLNAGGTSLRLARIDAVTPQPFTIVGWRVSDILASIAALDDQGVAVIRFDGLEQDDTGVWTTPGGDRVAWFHDPDGNTLSITEFA